MIVSPANQNTGIIFKRTDINENVFIKADVRNVVETYRGTTLGTSNYKIYTIEHFLSALNGLGIDNALVEIDNIALLKKFYYSPIFHSHNMLQRT